MDLLEIAKTVTREEFLRRETNEEICISSRFNIGYSWFSEECKNYTCKDCINKAIKNIKFKGE